MNNMDHYGLIMYTEQNKTQPNHLHILLDAIYIVTKASNKMHLNACGVSMLHIGIVEVIFFDNETGHIYITRSLMWVTLSNIDDKNLIVCAILGTSSWWISMQEFSVYRKFIIIYTVHHLYARTTFHLPLYLINYSFGNGSSVLWLIRT